MGRVDPVLSSQGARSGATEEICSSSATEFARRRGVGAQTITLRGTALSSFQEVHGKAAETQILISTDWIANISIRSVALLVTKAIDRHRQKLHAILEIVIHV